MTNEELIQKIKAEIERLMDEYKPIVGGVDELTGAHIVLAKLPSFLDTLEEERPEPYNPVYDEAYLNEKIKKATESWMGVDVDAMLAECRGYDEENSEKPVPNDLEEAADNHIRKVVDAGWEWETRDIADAFIAGAKWQKEQDDKELSDLLTIAHLQGAEQMKEQMMKDIPKWHNVQRGSCFDKHTNFILSAREGHFYCSSMEVPRDGYILLVDELERLPKEDEK